MHRGTTFMFLPLRNNRLLQRPETAQLNTGTQRESQRDPEQIQELSTPQPPPRGYTSSLTTIFAAQKPYCLVFSLNFPSVWGGTDERTHLWSSRFALPTTNELCLSKWLVGSRSQLLQRPGWCSAGEELHKTRISAVLSQNLNVFFSPQKMPGAQQCSFVQRGQTKLSRNGRKPYLPKLMGKREQKKSVGLVGSPPTSRKALFFFFFLQDSVPL